MRNHYDTVCLRDNWHVNIQCVATSQEHIISKYGFSTQTAELYTCV